MRSDPAGAHVRRLPWSGRAAAARVAAGFVPVVLTRRRVIDLMRVGRTFCR